MNSSSEKTESAVSRPRATSGRVRWKMSRLIAAGVTCRRPRPGGANRRPEHHHPMLERGAQAALGVGEELEPQNLLADQDVVAVLQVDGAPQAHVDAVAALERASGPGRSGWPPPGRAGGRGGDPRTAGPPRSARCRSGRPAGCRRSRRCRRGGRPPAETRPAAVRPGWPPPSAKSDCRPAPGRPCDRSSGSRRPAAAAGAGGRRGPQTTVRRSAESHRTGKKRPRARWSFRSGRIWSCRRGLQGAGILW